MKPGLNLTKSLALACLLSLGFFGLVGCEPPSKIPKAENTSLEAKANIGKQNTSPSRRYPYGVYQIQKFHGQGQWQKAPTPANPS